MKQLTPMDSYFFHVEAPNQPMMLGSLWLCDQSEVPGGVVRHKEILQYISDRLNTTSYFRRRLQEVPFGLDDPYWLEDENFDLEYHVRHVGLPQPGDWRQLCIFTARTLSRSVDMERAPWEMYIIEGLDNVEGVPPNSFAVLIRFHHAYVDGKSSVELSTAMMEDTPDHQYGRKDRVEVAERAPSHLEMWARTAPRLVTQSFRSLRAGMLLGRKSAELAWRMQFDAATDRLRAPRTIFNVPVTPHRSYGGYAWNIPELKQMRQLCKGATLNDVVIAIIAGGMRRYLASHKALPDETLIALCPVSIRPEEARYDGGNLLSAMYIGIGSEIEDPVRRLETVHRRTAKGVPLAKEVLVDLVNAAGDLVPAYMRAFAGWVQHKTRVAAKVPIVNTVITNVPGIPGLVPRYFAGARIASIFPMLPVTDGIAIGHVLSGIYDSLNLGVVADRKVVGDMDHYIACIDQSTREYRAVLEQMQNLPVEQADADVLSQPVPESVLAAMVMADQQMTALDHAKPEDTAAETSAKPASTRKQEKVAASTARKPATAKRIGSTKPSKKESDIPVAGQA